MSTWLLMRESYDGQGNIEIEPVDQFEDERTASGQAERLNRGQSYQRFWVSEEPQSRGPQEITELPF